MNVLEEGVLLLCCRLGEKTKKPLTLTQFKELGLRVLGSLVGGNRLTELTAADFCRMGYGKTEADRLIGLLDRQEQLHAYLSHAEALGIHAITRVSDAYPARITKKQLNNRPPVLFAMGEDALLQRPAVAVVGSRQLLPENEVFAAAAGRLAAEEGLVLVSGGAKGADTAAQEACLNAGGSCIVFVPDRLDGYTPKDRVLYISEDGYDIPFSAARALHRNGLIHMTAERTLAAQSSYKKGGTWQGCTENLKHGWSELFVFDDGTQAMDALIEMGATGITRLQSLRGLQNAQTSLF